MEYNPFNQKSEPIDPIKDQKIENFSITEQEKNIHEIFRLNPDLENKVDEILGKDADYRDIRIELGRSKDVENLGKVQNINVYYKDDLIVDSDNSVVNKSNNKLFLVTKSDGLSYIGDINLPEELRNKGLGLKILQRISNTLNTKIIPTYLSTGGFTSDHAKNMWSKVNNEINPNYDTEKLYTEYLKTIFPESKVKDILWHGTPKNIPFDKFTSITKNVFGKEIKNAPVYFTNSLFYAKGFAENEKQYKKIENSIPSVVPALINIKEFTPFNKPINYDGNPSFKFATEYNKENFKWTVYTASPDDIHILGSKADIEKFKEFASNMVR